MLRHTRVPAPAPCSLPSELSSSSFSQVSTWTALRQATSQHPYSAHSTSHSPLATEGRAGSPLMCTLPKGPTAHLPTCLPPSLGHRQPEGRDQGLFTEHRAWPREETRKMLRMGGAAGDVFLWHPGHTTGSNPGTRSSSAQPSQGRLARPSSPWPWG